MSLIALVAALALLAPGAASAQVAPVTATGAASASAATTAAPSKKQAYLAAKAADQAAARPRRPTPRVRPGKRPPAVVSVFNTWTREYLVLDRDDKAPLPPPALVDRFLRCHYTNQATGMRPELIATQSPWLMPTTVLFGRVVG